MYCRKCGTRFDDELAACPSCGTKIILKEDIEEIPAESRIEQTLKEEISKEPEKIPSTEAGISTKTKKKMIVGIISGIVLIVILIVAFFGGSNKGTFENYDWEMTQEEVIEEGLEKGLYNLSKRGNYVVFSLKDFWGATGSDAMASFSFEDEDESLSEVNILTAGENETDAPVIFDQYLERMTKLHGKPYELDDENKNSTIQMANACWKTKTGEARLSMLGGLLMIEYYQEGFAED